MLHDQPEEDRPHDADLFFAYLKYAQSVPYSAAVNSCQDTIALRMAAFFERFPPLVVPE